MKTWEEVREVHQWLPQSSDGWHQHSNGGGWIQNTATVHGAALVCGSALVYGSAQVYDTARVYGSAQVYDTARVCGSTLVYGSAQVAKTPINVTGLRYDVLICDKLLTIGCQQHEPAKWRRFTPDQIKKMDTDAATFWRRHRDALLVMCKHHQAKPRKATKKK